MIHLSFKKKTMKKTLLFLLITSSLLAQNTKKVATTILDLQRNNTQFASHSIFKINPNFENTDYKKSVSDATIVKLDLEKVNQIVLQKSDYIALEIPYLSSTITVLLYKVETQTQDFQIDTDKTKNVPFEKGVHYRGIINNDSNSLVSFNFYKNQMNGVISNIQHNNLVIGKLILPNNTNDYIIYSDKNLKQPKSFECATPDVLPEVLPNQNLNQNRAASLTDRCVTMYFEIDYDLYIANGSDVAQTNIWMNSVFNNVQTIYSNDDIDIAIKSIFVWTTPDPYFGNFSYDYLNQFHNLRPVFNGDLGQLIAINSGGLGGVAETINGLCSGNNHSFSDVFFEFNSVPDYSWTIMVVSHEFGHLLGSPHTHGCYWNGNNTPIDGCGPTYNIQISEGDCEIADIPTEQEGGTIMSYCHLLEFVGINFASGFGPQPAALIAQTVDASTCLSTDCINTCISFVSNVQIDSSTLSSATISWNDDSNNTSWQVAAATAPFEPENWITTSQNPYTFNDLAPNSYYRFLVRHFCDAPMIATALETNVLPIQNDDFCAGKPFLDAGGADFNYQDNENWIRTIAPINPLNKIKVVFNSIDIEFDYDFLYIFNGNDTDSPEMTNGGITGTDVVGPFESTAASGALTFQFISDGYVTNPGWNANFSCLNLSTNESDFVDFSYYPNPVTNAIAIQSKNEIQKIAIFSIDGKLLYQNNKKQMSANVDLSNYAAGTYIFKVQFENKPVTFKIVKQ